MFTQEQHIDNLVRHITLVRDACLLMGKRLIARGEQELGRIVISRGFKHDWSKFHGIEWDYLHAGNDVPKEKLELAIKQHISTNCHHPEYWGSIEKMSEDALAECVCDWYARSQEFGTCLRDWIKNTAIAKYKIEVDGKVHKLITKYVDILLEDFFVKGF